MEMQSDYIDDNVDHLSLAEDHEDEDSTSAITSQSSSPQDHPLFIEMLKLNKKFRLSCRQVVMLNNFVEDLQARYNRAVQGNNRNYRYFLRLRIATVEGIRNMLYEYACTKAEELDDLHQKLIFDGIIEHELDLSEMEHEI